MKRIWLSISVIVVVGLAAGALTLFGWTVNETRFDRRSPVFEEFESQVENLPGVEDVDAQRWVEAPMFSNPTSSMSVSVDQSGFPGVLEQACSTDYPDAVTWSIRVRTHGAAEVSLHAPPTAPSAVAYARCPEFGFNAVPLVAELDRVAPGLAIQPAIWEDDRFALVALEEEMSTGFVHLLPLIENADDLLAAGGFERNESIEINAMNLGFVLKPGESAEYLALLTELAQVHAVSSFWADGGGTPVDGVEKIQMVAPDHEHEAIENAIRFSSLHIANLPVRFLEQ